jgi:N-glycosylase/DNA lyase
VAPTRAVNVVLPEAPPRPAPLADLDWAALWAEFGPTFERRTRTLAGSQEKELRGELLFCLLGGHGVTYELGRSAADHLADLDIFNPERGDDELEELLCRELAAAQFEPRRTDGHLRRYRYPHRKGQQIVACRRWLHDAGPLADTLRALPCERERRRLLCDCPGIGPKSASWLLRNCGLAQELAILDVHVMRVMTAAGRLGVATLPRDYEHVETVFLDWCHELGAPAAAFDLLVWELARALRS